MKKNFLVIVAMIVAVIAAGCVSTGADGAEQPEWVRKPPKDADVHYFIGVGREAQTETAKRGTARADALVQLSQWKESKVASSLKDYVQEAGTVGNTQALQDFEQAVVAKAKANTSGFKEVESWVDRNGNYRILYSYPNSDLKNDFKSTANTFVRNQAAAFAEFKADEAYRLLEKELEKD
jgi:hypothetical protein